MTQKQIESLENKIYESLIANPENGLGEMGACRDEAQRIVSEWVNDNGIKIESDNVPKDDTFNQCLYCGHYDFGHFRWCYRPSAKIN